MIIPMPRRAEAAEPAEAASMDLHALRVRAREFGALGKHQEAAAAWREVLDREYDDPGAAHQLGKALLNLNKLDDAVAAFRRAAEHDPATAAIRLDLARALSKQGKFADAKMLLDDLVARDPADADALLLLAAALRGLGRNEEALAYHDRAVEQRPDHADSRFEKAGTLKALKRNDDAEAAYRDALRLQPTHREAALGLGRLLIETSRADEAVALLAPLSERQPDQLPVWTEFGSALLAAGDHPRALMAYRAALAIQPASAALLCNMSLALFSLDRFEEGIAACRRALAIEPASSTAQFNIACMELTQGHFREGWEAYEYRFPMGHNKAIREDVKAAPWCGEDLAGKSIVVFGEQASGDCLQFARYLPELSKLGARVQFVLPARLKRLLSTLPETVDLAAEFDGEATFDFQCAMMGLPLRFTKMGAPIPDRPYLHAEPERVATWRERLGGHGFRIAVAWQGAVYAGKRSVRSFPLQDLKPLADLPGVRLISLQIGNGSEQIESSKGMNVETLGPGFDAGDHAFLDTAAVIESVDLVVTCDTSIAHLAGALGKPVWIALNESPEWRWQRHRTDTVWYPSARLFRQKTRGDWPGVFADMAKTLAGDRKSVV